MSWILATALLAAPPSAAVDVQLQTLTPAEIVEQIDSLPTGTLIFSKGDCLAVRVYTQSRFTHVAAVAEQGSALYVYDSANGHGVRKQDLASYLAGQSSGEIHIVQPRIALTKNQQDNFCAELEEQVGRPYAVRHHLTGKRNHGLHCSEYVTDALVAAGVMKAVNPPLVSPASLHKGVHIKQAYVPRIAVKLCTPKPEPADSWCGRAWQDTKLCTKRCYLKMRGWFCCY